MPRAHRCRQRRVPEHCWPGPVLGCTPSPDTAGAELQVHHQENFMLTLLYRREILPRRSCFIVLVSNHAQGPNAPATSSVVIRDAEIRYRVYEDRSYTARQLISSGLRSRRSTWVDAVKGVSFDIGLSPSLDAERRGIPPPQY